MSSSGTTAGQPPVDADRLADVLGRSTFVIMGVLTTIAAEHELSLTQLRLLGVLRDRRVRMSALAIHLNLDKSSMTGLVDRAEHRGLLERTPSESDGRAIDVMLTPAGRRMAERLRARKAEALSTLVDALSPAEQRRLQSLLTRLLGMIGEPR